VDYVIYTGKVIKIGFKKDKSYGTIKIIVPEPETQVFFNRLKNGELILITIKELSKEKINQ
jgi:hypothetical protein